jgi:hypothetical protein
MPHQFDIWYFGEQLQVTFVPVIRRARTANALHLASDNKQTQGLPEGRNRAPGFMVSIRCRDSVRTPKLREIRGIVHAIV